MTTNPPAEGLCPVCEQTIRIRTSGVLYQHPRPAHTVVNAAAPTFQEPGDCSGTGQKPSVVLEMTFARWLHAHRARRDFRTNDTTCLAQYAFGERNSCAPLRTPADVTWTTADGFHADIHSRPTGVGPQKTSCDWRCRMLTTVQASYQVASAASKGTPR